MKWNILLYGILFSGLGALFYFLLANHTELSPRTTNILYSKGALVYFVTVFNVLGYSSIRLSSLINEQYALHIRPQWKMTATYLVVMILFLLLNYGLLVVAKMLAGIPNPFGFQSGGWRILLVIWLIELVIWGQLLVNRFIRSSLKLQKEAAQLQMENNAARYTALQNQLNPHFLFNSLNTLIAEIEYSPKNAVHFTKHLSSVYRYVLQCQDKTLVTLAEELEFMQSYLFLHEVRLGDCIRYECNILPYYTESMLPPLTLQLLVENVIKHNSITLNKPMNIHIEISDDQLLVSNPIHPKKSSASSGVGLQNLSNRCQLMLGKKISIDQQEKVFTVKVPLLV